MIDSFLVCLQTFTVLNYGETHSLLYTSKRGRQRWSFLSLPLEPLPGFSEARLFLCSFREGPFNGAGHRRGRGPARGVSWAGFLVSRRKSEECGIWGQAPSLLWETLSWGQNRSNTRSGQTVRSRKLVAPEARLEWYPAAHSIASS